jgi:hypothetical protein
MAPEQARGKPVDRRADIWAFGVVLYEMLTGERLFRGDDVSEILAAVIKEEPRLDRVPSQVRQLLRRCLEKDPQRRLRDIGDAMALVNLAPEAMVIKSRSVLWPVIAAAAIVASAALAWVHFREVTPRAEVMRFQIPLPPGNIISLSPNGRRMGYGVSSKQGSGFWIREMDSVEAHRLNGIELEGTHFWSADSRFVAFASGGKLKKVDASGGLPQDICDVPALIGGSWSRQGTIIFSAGGGAGVFRTAASGGTPTRVTTGDDLFPWFLPDGRHFLYLHMATPDDTGIYLGSLDDAPERQSKQRLLASTLNVQYVPSFSSGRGYILFYRDGAVLAQPFDESRLALAGEALPVVQGVGTYAASALFSASEKRYSGLSRGHGDGEPSRLV